MSETKPSDTVVAVPSDIDVAFSGPAVIANRFFVTIGANGVRIAFTEQSQPTTPPHFRTAVSLSMQDGIALKNLLAQLLADIERQIQEQTDQLKKETSSG